MMKLLRSGLLTGYLIGKAIVVGIWGLLAWGVLYLILQPGGLIANFDSSKIAGYIIFAVLIFLFAFFGGRFVFGGIYCVPYWGKVFSLKQIAGLLEGEEFERVEFTDFPRIKNIWESQRWYRIDNFLFPKALCSDFFYNRGKGRSGPHTNVIFINGEAATFVKAAFYTDSDEEAYAFGDAVIRMMNPHHKHNTFSDAYEKKSKKVFDQMWEGRPLKELADTDLNAFRREWENRMHG